MSCWCWNKCSGQTRLVIGRNQPMNASQCAATCALQSDTQDYLCHEDVNEPPSKCTVGEPDISQTYLEIDPTRPGCERVKASAIGDPFFDVQWGTMGRVMCCLPGFPESCVLIPPRECYSFGGAIRGDLVKDDPRLFCINPSDNYPLCRSPLVNACSESGCCCTISGLWFSTSQTEPVTIHRCTEARSSGPLLDEDGDGSFDDVPCDSVAVREYLVPDEDLFGLPYRNFRRWEIRVAGIPLAGGVVSYEQYDHVTNTWSLVVNPHPLPTVSCSSDPSGRTCRCSDFVDCPIDDTPGRCHTNILRPGFRTVANRTPVELGEDAEPLQFFGDCQRNFYGKVGYPLNFGVRTDATALICTQPSEFGLDNGQHESAVSINGEGDFNFVFGYVGALN